MAHGSHPHSHHHHHHHHTPDSSTRNIGLAFWLNLTFALIELAGGYWTQSFAVMSDALHDFGDALSFGVGYCLQRKSTQGPSESFSYGLRRLSLLSALISGVVISTGSILIGYESILAIREFGTTHVAREPHGAGMMALALLGIAMNGFAAWRMGLGHTLNEKMLRWHLIEDILGWIAVLVGGALVWAFKWAWLDPVLALAISVFVLTNVFRNLSSTISLFLQGNPDPSGLKAFRDQLNRIENVAGVHDVHFWSLDGVRHVLSIHVVLKDPGRAVEDKKQIRELSRVLGDCHLTIEIEGIDVDCAADCENAH